jgi:hypothetical protein
MYIYEPAPCSWAGYRLGYKQCIKAYRGVEVKLHMFLTSAKDVSEWLALHAG